MQTSIFRHRGGKRNGLVESCCTEEAPLPPSLLGGARLPCTVCWGSLSVSLTFKCLAKNKTAQKARDAQIDGQSSELHGFLLSPSVPGVLDEHFSTSRRPPLGTRVLKFLSYFMSGRGSSILLLVME